MNSPSFLLKYKIMLVAAVGITGFTVYLALTYSMMIDNAHHLDVSLEQRFPAVELVSELKHEVTSINQKMTLAITLEDTEYVVEAQQIATEARARLDDDVLTTIDPELVAEVKRDIARYVEPAAYVSHGLIRGEWEHDPPKYTIGDASQAWAALESSLETLKDSAYTALTLEMEVAKKEANNTLLYGIYTWLGVVSAVVMVCFLVVRSLSVNLGAITTAMENILRGEGDLSARLPVTNRDEVGKVVELFNEFVDKIRHIVTSVVEYAETLKHASGELEAASQEGLKSIYGQKDDVKNIVVAMEQMSSASDQISKDAESAVEVSRHSESISTAGREEVDKTVAMINQLAKEIESASLVMNDLRLTSDSIGEVLAVINQVAEQTNLLALNAAIEAARAGESGRGFAVVADEVRSLSHRTHESTQEIRAMIEQLQSKTHTAAQAMKHGESHTKNSALQAEKAGSELEAIAKASQDVRQFVEQIASAASEQNSANDEIVQRIASMSGTTTKTADISGKTAELGKKLNALSARLNDALSVFKT